MNYIAREIMDILTGRSSGKNELRHYGRSKKDGAPGPGSGRYPLGSGENAYQHRIDFMNRVQALRSQNMQERDIAIAVGCKNVEELRQQYSIARNEKRAMDIQSAQAMLADGKSRSEVARALGVRESTVRSWLNEKTMARTNAAKTTADFLRKQVDEKGMIDVGIGVEREAGILQNLNISRTKFDQALAILQEEGYEVYGGGVPQATNPGKQTNMQVLCPPGTEHREIYDYDKIKSVADYRCRQDENGNDIFEKAFEYPASLDSSRLLVRYRDDILPDGHKAIERDGTIEIRRGLPDLDLGQSHYAQVRILVDNDKYLKGMAYYSDDLPDGVDVAFNTNKKPGDKALKDIKHDDPNNPFGALLREEGGQYHYIDENGESRLGLINKTRIEGDWGEWSKDLPSQFLAKQPIKLIQTQLNLTMADKAAEFEEIMSLTNPTVKKHLLNEFAGACDKAAEDLQASALPRQAYQVLLPIDTLPDNQIYAPNYKDGEKVAVVRFPFAGNFEMAICTVNNKQPDGQRILGTNPLDAVGINSNVASRLSGADFDGDTALIIPCNTSGNKVRLADDPPLQGLDGFDPKMEYGPARTEIDSSGETHYYRNGHEYQTMQKGRVQLEMGSVSNLIMDMTLKGATEDELARAVRHSMVVIDAEKHKLDYRQSAIDNDIMALKRKYQEHYLDENGNPSYGASTLLTMAKSPVRVNKSRGTPRVNQEGKPWYDPNLPEGALIYKRVEETYVDKNGKTQIRTEDSTRMAQTPDARTLSSGTPQEAAYAEYANYMKSLANRARKEALTAGHIEYKKSSADTYSEEVTTLLAQLDLAQRNAPRERQAQLATASYVKALVAENPQMTKKDRKKYSQLALQRNRQRFGAHRTEIDISPRQWEAIQSGAISENRLMQILRFANADKVRQYAMPRTTNTITPAKEARIRALANSGYSNAKIADALGISRTSVQNVLKSENINRGE